MTYEVQHHTLCEGWVNTWAVHYPDGSSEPETFETAEQAQEALDEFFADIQAEIDAGQRAADDAYDRDEFRIVKGGAQ